MIRLAQHHFNAQRCNGLMTMHRIIATVLACALPLVAAAETVTGPARVVDGDSLRIGSTEIRMADIDAPEMKQGSVGRYARAVLAREIGDRPVTCEGLEHDRYGRLVGVCHVGRVNLNLAMVSAGAAFAYWPFRDAQLHRLACPDDTMAECHRTSARALKDEDAARAARRGFWAFDPLPAHPWCVRHPEGCRAQ